jgi:putative transcriptional regulator
MKSLEAQLLVASTDLQDPNFFRTVVLIFRHSEDGAAGVVLNRRMTATVQEVWRQVSETPCECTASLYLGGPVEGPLMVVHGDESKSEMTVLPGVYLTTGREAVEQLVLDDRPPLRFFVGYAGWGAGQLERELGEGAWRVAPATVEHVFGPEDELWHRLTKQITAAAFLSALNIKHSPTDPSMN